MEITVRNLDLIKLRARRALVHPLVHPLDFNVVTFVMTNTQDEEHQIPLGESLFGAEKGYEIKHDKVW